MDLDTFITTLYVWIDDWYKERWASQLVRQGGARVKMSDSEILTLGLLAQWRSGVAWQSERGLVRYMQKFGQDWFPEMLGKSQFNERLRQLWAVFVVLQQHLADVLETAAQLFECVDCTPLPSCSLSQAASHKRHWLDGHLGQGGNQGGWFYGEQVLMSVTSDGVITGWLIGPAHFDDRWMLEAFISTRQGSPALQGPAPRPKKRSERRSVPCWDMMSPRLSVGYLSTRTYLADRGFNGQRWVTHWQTHYHTTVITPPPRNAPQPWTADWMRWLAHHRQIIETVFSRLCRVFDLRRLNAHTHWGQITRLAAITAAYNFGVWINRQLARPDGALETLLC